MLYSAIALGALLSGAAAAPSTLINTIRASSVKAGPMLPLVKEKVELLAFAAELTQAVYYQGNTNCDAQNDPLGPDCDPFYPGYEYLGYQELYAPELERGEMTFRVSSDMVDANLFMDIGNYCFVVWRATIGFDWKGTTECLADQVWRWIQGFDVTGDCVTDRIRNADWLLRNLDFHTRNVAPIGQNTTCSVQGGIYEAYQGGERTDADLEDDIIQFVEGCMDDKPHKQLVLAGHSQGGGAAMMGALRFASRNPLTISLAGPPVLKVGEDCPAMNRDHIWRVVNTENSLDNTELLYDLISYAGHAEACKLGGFWDLIGVGGVLGTHIGAVIHLPPDSPIQQDALPLLRSSPLHPQQTRVAYWGPNDGEEEENYGPGCDSLSFTNEVGSGVHWVETGYLPKLKALLDGPFPINKDGYVESTLCTGDAECEFMCINNVCAAEDANLLPDGTTCVADDDCESGSCTGCAFYYNYYGGDWCCTGGNSDHGTTPSGDSCEQDGNCQSNRCTWDSTCMENNLGNGAWCAVCEEKLGNGASCWQDDDCQSDRCTWDFTCKEKLGNGASCGAMHMNDGDCASGNCSFSWRRGWRCVPSTHVMATSIGGDNIQIV